MVAAEGTTAAAALMPTMATGPTAAAVNTDMLAAAAAMATAVAAMATAAAAGMLKAVMPLAAAVMVVVAAAMLKADMAAADMAAAADTAAVAVMAVAADMAAADTGKRQPSSQSAHHARSGGAYQLRRFAFANLFYRSRSSSVVLKSVFSSRYLTITGA
jgi:hypothetical protein